MRHYFAPNFKTNFAETKKTRPRRDCLFGRVSEDRSASDVWTKRRMSSYVSWWPDGSINRIDDEISEGRPSKWHQKQLLRPLCALPGDRRHCNDRTTSTKNPMNENINQSNCNSNEKFLKNITIWSEGEKKISPTRVLLKFQTFMLEFYTITSSLMPSLTLFTRTQSNLLIMVDNGK